MTNNFDKICKYMSDLGIVETKEKADNSDLFFDVQLIRRGKDNPNLPSANYLFKVYYFDSIELFSMFYKEIMTCCDLFRLRAYVSVNAKSKTEITHKTLKKYATNVLMNEYKKPWRAFNHICSGMGGKEKRWVIDCDDTDRNSAYVKKLCQVIELCKSEYDEQVIDIFDTNSGVHIITHPFNTYTFEKYCKTENIEIPGIKKNHITLLYENLDYESNIS